MSEESNIGFEQTVLGVAQARADREHKTVIVYRDAVGFTLRSKDEPAPSGFRKVTEIDPHPYK
jgi:hypothetical protein